MSQLDDLDPLDYLQLLKLEKKRASFALLCLYVCFFELHTTVLEASQRQLFRFRD